MIFGVLIMVWNIEIFSQIPEFNIYKWVSLSNESILTNHKTIVHSAASVSGKIDEPYDNKPNTREQVPYQQQFNENLQLTEKFSE